MVESHQSISIRILIIFPSITMVILGLRMLSRGLSRMFGWDDVLILIAHALIIVQSVFWILCLSTPFLHLGTNLPVLCGPISQEDIIDFSRPEQYSQEYTITVQTTYFLSLGFVRVSVVIFILRLQQLPKMIRINLWALAVITVALMIAILFAAIFQCGDHFDWRFDFPLSIESLFSGKKPTELYRCTKQSAFLLSAGIISVVLDFWIILIPGAIVKGMTMPKKQKFMVVAILGVGAISVAMGIANLILRSEFWLPPGSDVSHSTTFGFGVVEGSIAIWAASVPALKSLITRFYPRFWVWSPIQKESDQIRSAANGDATERRSSVYGPNTSGGRISRNEEELRRFEHDINVSTLGNAVTDVELGHHPPLPDFGTSDIELSKIGSPEIHAGMQQENQARSAADEQSSSSSR